jgi:hypothetical protein
MAAGSNDDSRPRVNLPELVTPCSLWWLNAWRRRSADRRKNSLLFAVDSMALPELCFRPEARPALPAAKVQKLPSTAAKKFDLDQN